MSVCEPLVIDTDLNFPSDDLQALLLLVASKQVRIKGVSACAGNTFAEESLINISEALRLCALDHVPMANGASHVHKQPHRERALRLYRAGIVPFVGSHQKALEPRLQPKAHVARSGPVFDDLYQLLMQQTEPVHLVCLGPLTNVADALRRVPSPSDRIQMLWIMGGNRSFDEEKPRMDFNIWYDPDAAHHVFGSGLPIRLLPYETCRLARSTPELAARVATVDDGLATIFARDFAGMVAQHGTRMPLCDQLVALAIINPQVVRQTERVQIEVRLAEGDYRGSSSAIPNPQSTIEMVTDIDLDIAHDTLSVELLSLAAMPACGSVEKFLESPLYLLDASTRAPHGSRCATISVFQYQTAQQRLAANSSRLQLWHSRRRDRN